MLVQYIYLGKKKCPSKLVVIFPDRMTPVRGEISEPSFIGIHTISRDPSLPQTYLGSLQVRNFGQRFAEILSKK